MKKIAIIFGGESTEHEISIKSANYFIKNIDRKKYDVREIYIDKNGNWHHGINGNIIDNYINYLKEFDLIVPVLHGLHGEDGTIQGLLELINVPYTGCGVLSSSICMDKVYTKIIFDKCNIKNAKSIYIKYKNDVITYYDESLNISVINDNELLDIVSKKLVYPLFIKPSNSGSSVGVNKVNNENELINSIKEAAKYDEKILIEQGIIGKEVEIAVLEKENNELELSEVGEIISAEEFYSYSAKYNNANSKTIIPANVTKEQSNKIKELAKKAFIAVDGKGYARIDFLIEENTGDIYLNEINTIPGMTNISMYPTLMKNNGYTDTELINEIINNI